MISARWGVLAGVRSGMISVGSAMSSGLGLGLPWTNPLEAHVADLGRTGISQVRTVTVPVTDADRSIEFYVGTLGFEVRVDAEFGGGQRWVEVAPPGAETTVALAPPGGVQPGVDTGVRFATQDAAADHASLSERGVDVDPEVMRWPGVPPMFSLRDPDGNTLYIVENAS